MSYNKMNKYITNFIYLEMDTIFKQSSEAEEQEEVMEEKHQEE